MTFSNLPPVLEHSFMLTTPSGAFIKDIATRDDAEAAVRKLNRTQDCPRLWEYVALGQHCTWFEIKVVGLGRGNFKTQAARA